MLEDDRTANPDKRNEEQSGPEGAPAKTVPQGKARGSGKCSPGRPQKYSSLLMALPDDEVHTPASIVNYAEKHLLEPFRAGQSKDDRRLIRQRIRITLGRLSNNHNFPDEGDGLVTLKRQSPTPGWFGERWRSTIKGARRSQG